MALKKIVVGNVSLPLAKKKNLLYVDKTKFISILEESEILAPVFLRPRRFGKTIFAKLLGNYYDVNEAGNFESNFEGTWIYSHKTPEASSYCCLMLDFSLVSPVFNETSQSMVRVLSKAFTIFSVKYPDLKMPREELDASLYSSPAEILQQFLTNFLVKAKKGEKLFVVIDEYDQFANEILAYDKEAFRKITSAAKNNEGIIKRFYTTLKSYMGAEDAPIAKCFITGVSAVSLDSLTSGFNIATNISSFPEFAPMAGFTHDELLEVIDQTVDFSNVTSVSKNDLMDMMETYYDGYVFSPAEPVKVFNPNMSLGFLLDVIRFGKVPETMPGNTSDDMNRIRGMLELSEDESRKKIIDFIFNRQNITSGKPGDLNLNEDDFMDFDKTIWMLFYLGYLTFDPSNNVTSYRCPNEITYQTFIEAAMKQNFRTPSNDKANAIAGKLEKGDISGLVATAEESIAEMPSNAFSGFNERALQLVFYFIAKQYSSNVCQAFLEADAGNNGRADLYLKNKASGPDVLLEFKYISKTKASDAAVGRELALALEQVRRYKNGPRFKGIKSLKSYALVFSGSKAVAVEEV